MATTSDVAVGLLQAGALMTAVLMAQVLVVRHLPVDTIPGALRARVELGTRLRPWLILAAVLMLTTGAVVGVSG
jgi:hypothetical protein